jgi:hypothetical protein
MPDGADRIDHMLVWPERELEDFDYVLTEGGVDSATQVGQPQCKIVQHVNMCEKICGRCFNRALFDEVESISIHRVASRCTESMAGNDGVPEQIDRSPMLQHNLHRKMKQTQYYSAHMFSRGGIDGIYRMSHKFL